MLQRSLVWWETFLLTIHVQFQEFSNVAQNREQAVRKFHGKKPIRTLVVHTGVLTRVQFVNASDMSGQKHIDNRGKVQ